MLSSSKSKCKAPEHNGQSLDFICETCNNKLICSKCIANSHSKHKVETIEAQIQNWIQVINSNKKQNINSQNYKQLTDCFENVKLNLKNNITRMLKEIENKFMKFFDDYFVNFQDDLEILAADLEAIEDFDKVMKKFDDEMEKATKTRDLHTIYENIQQLGNISVYKKKESGIEDMREKYKCKFTKFSKLFQAAECELENFTDSWIKSEINTRIVKSVENKSLSGRTPKIPPTLHHLGYKRDTNLYIYNIPKCSCSIFSLNCPNLKEMPECFGSCSSDHNQVIFSGGLINGRYQSKTYLLEYNLGENKLEMKEGAQMLEAKALHTLLYISLEGMESVYSLGGQTSGSFSGNVEKYIYRDIKGSWISAPALKFPRRCISSCLLATYIYTFGGYNGRSLNVIEKLDLWKEADGWDFISLAHLDLSGLTESACIELPKNRVAILGGDNMGCNLDTIYIYDANKEILELKGTLAKGERFYRGQGTLHDGNIYVIGGASKDIHVVDILNFTPKLIHSTQWMKTKHNV